MNATLSIVEEGIKKIGGLRPFSQAIVIVYVFGTARPEISWIIGQDIVLWAAGHLALVIFLDFIALAFFKPSAPQLHPDTICTNCGEKDMKILLLSAVCKKCNYQYHQVPPKTNVIQNK